jgi:hypothetical protein
VEKNGADKVKDTQSLRREAKISPNSQRLDIQSSRFRWIGVSARTIAFPRVPPSIVAPLDILKRLNTATMQNQISSRRPDSSFLNTIPEDLSDGAVSNHNPAVTSAPAAATEATLKSLLTQRVGQTGTPSVCQSSVNSSTGGIDSVEGKLSIVSDMKAVIGGGCDTEEYDGNSPVSVLADTGRAKEEQHRAGQGKVRTLCNCFVLTRRNVYLGIAALLLTLGVFSAIVAVVVTSKSDNEPVERLRANNSAKSPMMDYVTTLLQETTANSTVWTDPESAAYKARDWIVYNDTLLDSVLKEGTSRLRQRYSLAVLWYATSGPTAWSINLTASKATSIDFLNPQKSECNWTGVWCDSLDTQVRSGNAANTSQSEGTIAFRILLRGMNLSGTIPPELSTCIPTLREFDLSFNALRGTIPNSLFEGAWANSLYWMDLSENQLTGSIPPAVWSFRVLEFMFLNQNQLTGPIVRVEPTVGTEPASNVSDDDIPQANFLKQVLLYENELTGSLPSWLTEMRSLKDWVAFDNVITGRLPDPPENLAKFDMSMNRLSGTIPDTMWSMITSPPLELLYLDNNLLSGPLPNSTQPRQVLQELWLHNNRLSGTIPGGFAEQWDKLTEIRIQGNDLTGSLGPKIDSSDESEINSQCRLIWPNQVKFIAECFKQKKTDNPPVQCDCCDECE